MTTMKRLKSAAHAAGFAMAPAEDFYREDDLIETRAVEDAWRGAAVKAPAKPGTALMVRRPDASASWLPQWIAAFGSSRLPA